MKLKKIVAALSVFALTAVGFTGCGEEQAANSNTLKVGSTIDFAPFEFQDENQKEYQGFDMDLIRALGKEMGKEVDISNIGFDGLIPALQAGNIDVVISGMTITDERKENVLFSDPYYKSGLTIVVRSDDTSINSFADLAGKNIAVQIGTTSSNEAKKIENASVKEYNTPADCFIELQNQGADAVINDRPVNDYAIVQGGIQGVKSLSDVLTAEDYGIAMAKTNTDLQKQVNDALKKLHDNGEYDKIYTKWFGAVENKDSQTTENQTEQSAENQQQ